MSVATTSETDFSVAPLFQLNDEVRLGLTCFYTFVFVVFFLVVYTQLWMIYYQGHRLRSPFTTFLFLTLIWLSLRIVLFSFYFKSGVDIDALSAFLRWLLFSLPVCLQFVNLSLLVVFLALMIYRDRENLWYEKQRHLVFILLAVAHVIFVSINIVSAIVSNGMIVNVDSPASVVQILRVAICSSLFLLLGCILSYFVYRIGQDTSTSVVLEAKGLTKCQVVVTSVVIAAIYISRAGYNIFAITKGYVHGFGYEWTIVTDEVDKVSLNLRHGSGYVSFGLFLLTWEYIPTLIIILVYRVRIPLRLQPVAEVQDVLAPRDFGGYQVPPYPLFSDLNRYNIEEPLLATRLIPARSENNSLKSINSLYCRGSCCCSTPYRSSSSFPNVERQSLIFR